VSEWALEVIAVMRIQHEATTGLSVYPLGVVRRPDASDASDASEAHEASEASERERPEEPSYFTLEAGAVDSVDSVDSALSALPARYLERSTRALQAVWALAAETAAAAFGADRLGDALLEDGMEEGRRREALLEAAKTEVGSLYRRIEGAFWKVARELTREELEDLCEERGKVAAELLAARRSVVAVKRLDGEIRRLDGEIERLGKEIEAKEAETYGAFDSESAMRLTDEQVELERELAWKHEERQGAQEERQTALKAVAGLKEHFGPEYEGAMRRVVYQEAGPLDVDLYRRVNSGELGVFEIEGRRYVFGLIRTERAERTERTERTEGTEKNTSASSSFWPSVFPVVGVTDVEAVVGGDAGKTMANYERVRKACESREFVKRGLEAPCAGGASGPVHRALRCMCDAYAELGATDGTKFVPMVEDPSGARSGALGRPLYRTFLQPSVELMWEAYKLLCGRDGAAAALGCLRALTQHIERAAEEMSASAAGTAFYTMPSARVELEASGRGAEGADGCTEEGAEEGDGAAPPAAKRARVAGGWSALAAGGPAMMME
jgi:hypothetical protein